MPGRRDAGGSEAEELARLRAENARLLKAEKEWQLEREILRRAAAYFARGGEVSPRRWDFVSDNRASFGVKRICRVLGVSRSGYYRHLATAQARTERHAEEKRTVTEIRAIHAEHQGAYGAPRVHAGLRARGRRINHIVGRHLRRKKRTTISAAAFAEACRRHGVRRSMGRVGSSYDHALVESFFQGLKRWRAVTGQLPQGQQDGETGGRSGRTQSPAPAQPATPPARLDPTAGDTAAPCPCAACTDGKPFAM